MFSLSMLGLGIGSILLWMSSKKVDETRWVLAVDTIKRERKADSRTRDEECSRSYCDHYRYLDGKCNKPWDQYCDIS